MNQIITTQIDRVPISTLLDRYEIGKTALYDRLKKCGITPERDGKNSYISGEDLLKLDAVDRHLKTGGGLSKITSTSKIIKQDFAQITRQIILETNNPFCDLQMLQNLYEKGWLIETSRLAAILNILPSTLNRKKEYFYCGFVCVKVKKQRGLNVWEIKK